MKLSPDEYNRAAAAVTRSSWPTISPYRLAEAALDGSGVAENQPGPRVIVDIDGCVYSVYLDTALCWTSYPSGSETLLPTSFRVKVVGRLPYAVELTMAAEDGAVNCRSLTVEARRAALLLAGGQEEEAFGEFVGTGLAGALSSEEPVEITSEGLRGLPVGRLTRNAALAAIHRRDPANGQPRPLRIDAWAELYEVGAERPSRRRRLDDAHYREVAATCKEAWAAGHPHVKAVAARYPTAPSTAARWVGEARARGFLPPAGHPLGNGPRRASRDPAVRRAR